MFTHDALLEAIRCGQTVITCTELKETYDQLNHLDPATGKTGLMKEYGVSAHIIYYIFSVTLALTYFA